MGLYDRLLKHFMHVLMKGGADICAAAYWAGVLTWVLTHPAVIAIPNFFETKGQAFERELRQFLVGHYVSFLQGSYAKTTGLADLTIYVDEAHCASFDCTSFPALKS